MMAAVKSPFMPSPNSGLMSAFSPYSDSPSSPAYPPSNHQSTKRSSTDSAGHLLPNPQKSPQLNSPSDCDPSPIVSSNGTDATDFDETADENSPPAKEEENAADASVQAEQNQKFQDRGSIRISTKDEDGNGFRPSSSEDDHPTSVIHAPMEFQSFQQQKPSPGFGRSTPTPSQRSDITVISPREESSGAKATSPLSPPPISTEVPPSTDSFTTPRAQTRQEAETLHQENAAKAKAKSLEDIPENQTTEMEDQDGLFQTAMGRVQETSDEVAALRLALSECWTLCNTLGGLSHIHRQKSFRNPPRKDGLEQAWKSCWKLCQKLYDTWDENEPSQVAPTLKLCREFCQSLFDARQRENEASDAVLRVSFELNNHLYNTHDRALPEAFRERTLDFYITLCHRLMKQRNGMMEDADTLLRACWSLAEMLFSLRQNRRERMPADEELLGSAVQSCWELCDIFREGWTQVRPDRGTPRPSPATFTQTFQQVKETESNYSKSSYTISLADQEEQYGIGRPNPETPTTIFEDTQQMSPDESSVPNIVVLGPEATTSHDRYGSQQQWSGGSDRSSTFSGHSRDSGATTASSSSTIINPAEDPRLTCLRLLIIKAAINLGFSRADKLVAFVKAMPSNSFGSAAWQVALLEQYKKLVTSDPTFKSAGPPRRATAPDVARSVRWMVASGQYVWLRDLFRWVFGFHVDEADMRPGVDIHS